jgi:hypothetical protein
MGLCEVKDGHLRGCSRLCVCCALPGDALGRLPRPVSEANGERGGVRGRLKREGHSCGASPSPNSSCGNHRAALSPQAGRGRNNDECTRNYISPFQTAFLVPAARFRARGLHLASRTRNEGWRSAEITFRCSVHRRGGPCGTPGACEAPASLGDARLSALHRGDFGPGAALLPHRQLSSACASASNRIGSSELLAHGS